MLVVSPALSEVAPVGLPDDPANAYGSPCVFASCSGFFHPAEGAIGVVLCAPWGFEDLTMRKSWRLLAEAIAQRGYPCLRFDYPGTGNSKGTATDPTTVAQWVHAIHQGADFLRRASGVRKFVFIGQSLGATLAVEAARTRGDVDALHLIAPVVKGRTHVRELAVTAKMVADKLGIEVEAQGDEALSVMGFALSTKMVDSLKTLDLTKIDELPVGNVVVYDQPDRKASAELAEHVRRLGPRVTFETLEPYHLMISDATVIQPLPVPMPTIIADIEACSPLTSSAGMVSPLPLQTVMVDETWREEPIRFGPKASLFGMLCQPLHGGVDGATAVILLNRGLNAHIGWRRVSVDQARGLAAAGITSLRIDVAGLGESRDAPRRPPNLIYSDVLIPDITAAVDVLAARGFRRIMLAGVCSGAYMALTAGAVDPRVTDIVAVNTQRFVWNPRESVEDVIRFGLRSMNDYVGDIRSGGAIRKLIRSRRRIAPAMVFLARRSVKNMMARVPLRLRSLVLRGSMASRVERFFAAFAARGTRVSLVFAAADPGLMELRNYYGPDGRDLRLPNVTISIIPGADHNLTTTATSRWMLEHIIGVTRESGARDAGRAAARQSREPHRAVCPT